MTIRDRDSGAGLRSVGPGEMLIEVSPVGGGWSLSSPGLDGPLMFLSGGEAERSAERLAERIARLGRWVRIEIRDRGGRVAGLRRAAPPQQLLRASGGAPVGQAWT